MARGVVKSGVHGRIPSLDPGHQPAGLGVGQSMPAGPEAVAGGADRDSAGSATSGVGKGAGKSAQGDPGVDRTNSTDPGHS